MAPRPIAWSIRAFFFAVVGVLTFVLQPPGATAENAQLVAYVLAGLGLLAWAMTDMWPAAARYRARAMPLILGVIAVAGGFACTAGSNENNCPVMLASMATTGAGTELGLGAGWLVAAASMVAIDANWLIYRDGSAQLSAFLLYPLVPLSGLLIGRVVHGRRVQAEQSAALTQQLLAVRGQADVLGERARIAREIHDVLAHSLGALGIQIQAARAVLTDQQERLRLLNGTLAAGPGDRRWTVTAELPLASADQPLAPADLPPASADQPLASADQPQEVTS
jgi:signal transduction histidine kinase